MNYWVYKCNARGESAGNVYSGDWEGDDAFGGGYRPFGWGGVDYMPDLLKPQKGDRIIAHQSDRQLLVGVAEVIGVRKGEFRMRPLERINADMKDLKKRHVAAARIPAYHGGNQHAIREITNRDAETLLRLARASVANRQRKAKQSLERLTTALEDVVANGTPRLAAGAKDVSTGQGFGLTALERRVVEERAVRLATEHFRKEGWLVEDVGARESFDLRCRRHGVEMHVEVKGTTGRGEKVILPKNEVIHARSYKRVALVIVHSIGLRKGRPPRASGGRLVVKVPWKVADEALEPLAYYYRVA
jgi:hypothetical protein